MTQEEREKWLETATYLEIKIWVDEGLRHKMGIEPYDYLKHWCEVARHFVYATQDTTWGEFEKEFAIIIRRLVVAERKVKLLEKHLFDFIEATTKKMQETMAP